MTRCIQVVAPISQRGDRSPEATHRSPRSRGEPVAQRRRGVVLLHPAAQPRRGAVLFAPAAQRRRGVVLFLHAAQRRRGAELQRRAQPRRGGLDQRPTLRWALLTLCLLAALGARVARADPAAATVTYVDSSQRVYLDRGADEGLRPGMSLTLTRQGKGVATLELTDVSARRAAARVVDAPRPPRQGDVASFDAAPIQLAGPPSRQRSQPQPLGEARGAAWRGALLAQERPLVRFQGSAASRGPRAWVRAETQWDSRAYRGAPQLRHNEQRISLWSQGKDLGVAGLDLRIRGDVRLRYGGGPYDLNPGQLAIPELREVALTYAARGGLRGAAGRFKPDARLAGVMDGAQLSWGGERVSVSAFGGLRPSLSTLAPRLDAPAFGVAATLLPDPAGEGRWRISTAYLAEGGGSLRHSLALDTRVGSEGRGLRQQATLRLPGGGDAGGVALLTLQGHLKGARGRGIDGSVRYLDQALAAVDVTPQSEDWLTLLEGRALARADLGATLPAGERSSWRPYAYWDHQRIASAADVYVVAGGLAWHRRDLGDAGLSLDVRGDYGDGTRQQARLAFSVGAHPSQRLSASLGTLHQWTYTHVSGLHTFQHIAQGSLAFSGRLPVDLWLGLQGAVDHHPYFTQLPGMWGAGQLGLSYDW